ncbi:hypothetical protein [Roseateles puraquae]|uniref:hypothetical protein n=1 Tax=Roseateles puraquae TaxID=431059 RepID=UPI0031DEECBF
MSDTDVRPPALSTYQVIPYLKTGHHLQCTYLNRRGDPVDRDNLNSRGQGCNTDFVCLQSMAGVVPAVEPPDGRPLDGIRLLAAVVKTLYENTSLPNVIPADSHQRVVLPVLPGTRRGVILVYERIVDGQVVGLVASTDPEIKNSTSA